MSSTQPAEPPPDLVLLRRAKDRIDREFARPLDVGSIARSVGLSSAHLRRRFRDEYGEPPYSYLMTRRIERAMALLRRADRSVTEACFDTSIVLQPPAADPSISDAERATISAMMDEGTFAGVNLSTPYLDAVFERIEAAGADVVQPVDQDYGLRDCSVRDPDQDPATPRAETSVNDADRRRR